MGIKSIIKFPGKIIEALKFSYDEYSRNKYRAHSQDKFCGFGSGSVIERNVSISDPSKICIGTNVLIQSNVIINSCGGLYIGNYIRIGLNTKIITFSHNYLTSASLPYDKKLILKPVVIRDFVWIGWDVVIMPGVELGEGSIISAGSVVTKDVPEYSVVLGNPAEVIGHRNKNSFEKCKMNNKYLSIQDEQSGNFEIILRDYYKKKYYDELKKLNMV
jgi:acetyltransferase-like isoleucine patch superfamily enzyme